MSAENLTTGRFPYGTVYLVDPQLDIKEKRRNLETIRHELNFNTVVIWPPCSRWDAPEPGGMAFDSIDEVMDICAELDLKAILEFQGQNPSYQERPESAMIPADTWVTNARDIRFSHPQYYQETIDYMQAVAKHFKGHPALLAYDIFNEIGNESFDYWTLREFVKFLKLRYEGSIKKLNDAWCCFFATFDQIPTLPPQFGRWRWSSIQAKVDWQHFRNWHFNECLKKWTNALREVDEDVIIFADILGVDSMHTRPGGYFGVNDWDVAENVEVLGLSCYGNMLGKNWPTIDSWRWAQWWRSATSAAAGKQTMISEMMTQNRTLFPWESSSMSDQVGLWSYQAMFHAIGGLIYWKFRPFRRGLQVGGRGLTDFDANVNKFGRQAAEVASFAQRNADLLAGATPDPAGVAIMHDHNSQIIIADLINQNIDLYTDSEGGIFKGLWLSGISPMFVSGDDVAVKIPDWVKVLTVPCNIAVSQKQADNILEFVKSGGVLFTESRFALLDETATLWTHVPGGGLYDQLGIEEENFTCHFSGAAAIGSGSISFDNDFAQELKIADDVEVFAQTTDGKPLLLARKVGKGLYIHSTVQLGSLITTGRVGAEDLFNLVWEKLQPATTPVIKVQSKPALCDVSILLDKTSKKPVMAGITNYETTEAAIVLEGSPEIATTDGCDKLQATSDGDKTTVTIPPRSAGAILFK